MNAGLCVRIALYANCLARSFTRPGISGGALSANGEATQVSDSAITLDRLEAFEVEAQLTPEITFDHIFAFLNGVGDLGQLLFIEVLGAHSWIDLGFREDGLRVHGSDAVNISEGDIDALLTGNIDTKNSGHNLSFV